jgi:type VI secretion system protein ImpM
MSSAFADLIEPPPAAPGWYGKMPSLGDFASRRLPESFVGAWDRWLSAGIGASRAALGEAWLDCFLRAPIWRFGLMPGAIDAQTWFGVMMPSVDRVGRYFPLTIAAQVGLPGSLEAVGRLQAWLRKLHDAALATLDDGYSVAQFEAALETILMSPAADAPSAVAPIDPGSWPIHEDDLVHALAGRALPRLWQDCGGQSLWWCSEGFAIRPYRGLPSAELFHTLLAAAPPEVDELSTVIIKA